MAEGKKILLIDDDSDFRSSTRKILESGGYNVIEAATGEEGFSKAKSESPDLAVIDIIMESFSEGFNLIKRLNEDEWTRGVPRIVLTSLGLQQEMDMVTPEELGTKYIVQKPVKKDDFLKIVAAAIKTTPTGKKDDLGDAG
jgi:CheY-like chemotaxis protein